MAELKLNPSTARNFGQVFAIFCVALCSAGTALAAECFPRCDYTHDYGPYDFTYIRPGLYGYPICGPRGNCLPNLVYSTSGYARRGNIEVRFIPRPRYRLPPR
jgi:hypothetical protein